MKLIQRLKSLLCNIEQIPALGRACIVPPDASRRSTRLLLGRLMSELHRTAPKTAPFSQIEFGVFSQFGEDGIIQHLVNHVEPESCRFVEIGTQNYEESNTRFLLMNNYWRGLVIDSSAADVAYIQRDEISLYYALNCRREFVTAKNADQLVADFADEGRLGLLSIDIDGNDYWVWQAISGTHPDIVIVEYNALFGRQRAITIPYRCDFDREKAHPSRLYYGASLAALEHLARKKDYFLAGCNSAGNNAFFVSRKHTGKVAERSIEDAFRSQCFNEPSEAGILPAEGEKASLIAGLPVVNVVSGESEVL